MRIELINAAPVREALAEIEKRGQSATDTYNESVARVLSDVRELLAKAIADAENPDLSDGIPVKQYAACEDISESAVYKRISKNKVAARKGPDGWRILLMAS